MNNSVLKLISLFLIVFLHVNYVMAEATIYVYKDSDGITHFVNKKPPSGVQAKVFTAKKIPYSKYYRSYGKYSKLNFNRYASYIHAASRKHGVSTGLVRAVIHAESAFNPHAVSPKGAMGLMQLMPSSCHRYKVKNPYDPQDNINGGTHFLSDLIRKYKGNLQLVLAAYNAGELTVEKYNGVPPYSETKNYIQRVLALMKRYQGVS